MCLVVANVTLLLLNEIYKLKQMWLLLNVLYVIMYQSLIKVYVTNFCTYFGVF